MKRIFTLLISCLILSACSQQDQPNSKSSHAIISNWQVVEYLDEFNNSTGNFYLVNTELNGTVTANDETTQIKCSATVSDEKIRLINPRIEENPFYATAS